MGFSNRHEEWARDYRAPPSVVARAARGDPSEGSRTGKIAVGSPRACPPVRQRQRCVYIRASRLFVLRKAGKGKKGKESGLWQQHIQLAMGVREPGRRSRRLDQH